MAAIPITITGYRGPDGYPMEGTAYVFYCDQCGSFGVRRFIPPATRLAFLLACALAGTGLYRLGAARVAGIGWLWWWIAFAILCALGLSAVFAFHRHKCDRCGNTAITNQDVLHYSERMAEVHPFPRELYHAHDQLRGPWHTEALDLLGMIAIVPLVLLVSTVVPFAILVAGAVSELRRDRTSG